MSSIIPRLLQNESVFCDNDIEFMFNRYNQLKGVGSQEGLGQIAGGIATAFADFIMRVVTNLKSGLGDGFKDIKRSSLQIMMESHMVGMKRVFGSDYSVLMNIACQKYPFTVAPKVIGMYCNDTFTMMGMGKRIHELIEDYQHMAAAIRVSDEVKINMILAKINNTNFKSQLTIKPTLSKMVAGQSDTNRTTFGVIFNSTADFNEAVDITLRGAGELETAINVAKLLDNLYKAFDKVKEAIVHVSSSKFDLGKLSGLITTIHDTGSLFEDYAMLVKEYHHIEQFLVNVSEAALKVVKYGK